MRYDIDFIAICARKLAIYLPRPISMTPHERLIKVFTQALEIPEGTSIETLEYRGSRGWDSVGHMRLVAALETEFGLLLETEQILDFSSFQHGLGILKAHGITD